MPQSLGIPTQTKQLGLGPQPTGPRPPGGPAGGIYAGGLTPEQQWNKYYAAQQVEAQKRGQQQGTYAGEALKTLQGYVPGLFDPNTSSATGGGTVQGGPLSYYGMPSGASAGVPPPATLAAPNSSAAQAAEFGRAKDLVGESTKGALTGLKSSLGASGMLGSGAAGRQMTGVINQGQKSLADVAREQAIKGSDLANQNALAGYQGAITQRGQDIGAQESANSLRAQLAQSQSQYDLNLAEQNRQAKQQQYAAILSALGGLNYGGSQY